MLKAVTVMHNCIAFMIGSTAQNNDHVTMCYPLGNWINRMITS